MYYVQRRIHVVHLPPCLRQPNHHLFHYLYVGSPSPAKFITIFVGVGCAFFFIKKNVDKNRLVFTHSPFYFHLAQTAPLYRCFPAFGLRFDHNQDIIPLAMLISY